MGVSAGFESTGGAADAVAGEFKMKVFARRGLFRVLTVGMLVLSACGSNSSAPTAQPRKDGSLRISNTIAPHSSTRLEVSDVIDGGVGQYRLIRLEQYLKNSFKAGPQSGVQFRTEISPTADLDRPAAYSTVVQSDLSQIPNGGQTSSGQLPLAISRKDGSILRDLAWQFAVYGERAGRENELDTDSRAARVSSLQALLNEFESERGQADAHYGVYRTANDGFEIYIDFKGQDRDGVATEELHATYVPVN